MGEVTPGPNFLGLPDVKGDPDIVIAQVPYELTTSYGQGTVNGPHECIAASLQVELYDDLLDEELPAGKIIRTVEAWDGKGATLNEQLDAISKYSKSQYDSGAFPIFLGGEHGMLPAILAGCPHEVTLIQIDAHADLRQELDGDPYSHACAISRALDAGALGVHQVGIRAYSFGELQTMKTDKRIHSTFAKDIFHPIRGSDVWSEWLSSIENIQGPVHLTIDIDGLDGSLVPATGTPVPGGLSYWHVIETIEHAFANCNVVSADINEIVPQDGSPLTQFTAAMIATKVVAAHIAKGR